MLGCSFLAHILYVAGVVAYPSVRPCLSLGLTYGGTVVGQPSRLSAACNHFLYSKGKICGKNDSLENRMEEGLESFGGGIDVV